MILIRVVRCMMPGSGLRRFGKCHPRKQGLSRGLLHKEEVVEGDSKSLRGGIHFGHLASGSGGSRGGGDGREGGKGGEGDHSPVARSVGGRGETHVTSFLQDVCREGKRRGRG